MNITWTRYGHVTVRYYNGYWKLYGSLDEAVREVNYPQIKYRRQDGDFVVTPGVNNHWWYNPAPEHIKRFGSCELRDDCGLLIPDWAIDEAIGRTGIRYYWHHRGSTGRFREQASYRRAKGQKAASKARKLPSWRPSTSRTASQRIHGIWAADEAFRRDANTKELGVYIKYRRRWYRDPWDDYYDRSDWGVKSWKKHRKHQWHD